MAIRGIREVVSTAVQFNHSVMSHYLRPHGRSTPGFPVHHQLLELAQTHIHRVSDAIQPSHPLSSPSPPALNLPQHQGSFPMSWLFASGGQSIGASALSSALPMNYSGLISFRINWFDLLAIQGTPKSLLQHHSSALRASLIAQLVKNLPVMQETPVQFLGREDLLEEV